MRAWRNNKHRLLCLLALIVTGLAGPIACVRSQCDGADLSCNPLALALFLPTIEPDCLVRGSLPAAGWTIFSGGPAEDSVGMALCGLSDGSLILGGTQGDADTLAQGVAPLVAFQGAAATNNVVLMRANGDGILDRWTHIGAAGANQGSVRIAEAPNGGFYVASTSGNVPTISGLAPLSAFQGAGDILLVRYGADLQPLWFRYLGGATHAESPAGMAPTAEGGVMLAGVAQSDFAVDGLTPLQPYAGGQDGVILNVGPDGAVSWYTFFGSAGNDPAVDLKRWPDEALFSGQSAARDRFVVIGSALQDTPAYAGLTPRRAYSGGTDTYALHFDRSGTFREYSFYGVAGSNEIARRVLPMRSGELYLSMTASADIPLFDGLVPLNSYAGLTDLWLLRLGVAGETLSHRFLGTSANDATAHIAENSAGDVVIAAALRDGVTLGVQPVFANNGALDAAMLRIDTRDVVQAFAYYGGTGDEAIEAVIATADGGVVLAGSSGLPGFTPPAGALVLEAHNGGSENQLFMRTLADGRVTR